MSWLSLSRAAAVLALLCFFMPWFAISCQQTEIVSATGVQLATGTVPEPSTGGGSRDQDAAIWALLALLMLLAAAVLATAFATLKDRLKIVCALCGGAVLLLAGGMFLTVSSAKRELTASANGTASVDAAMRQLTAQGIRLEVKFGYWLTLLAATGASAAAYFGATGRVVPGWASAAGLRSVVATGGVDISGWKPTSFGASNDQRYWDGMSDKSDPDALEEYLTRFPDGQFAGLSRTRLLRAGREVPEPAVTIPSENSAPDEPPIAEEGDGDGEGIVEKFRSEVTMAAVAEEAPDDSERNSVCPACRAPVLEGARFCTECGLRLASGDAA